MKALELVTNPYPVEHIEHEVFCEGALAAMRALVAWRRELCKDVSHHKDHAEIPRRICYGCETELRAALEEK